jgi:hypothetical protein
MITKKNNHFYVAVAVADDDGGTGGCVRLPALAGGIPPGPRSVGPVARERPALGIRVPLERLVADGGRTPLDDDGVDVDVPLPPLTTPLAPLTRADGSRNDDGFRGYADNKKSINDH